MTASFTVSDGEASDTGELSVTVTGINDDPTASAIDAGTASEDDAPVTIDLLATANDVDGDALSAAGIAVTDETGASVAFTDRGDGTIAVDPGQFGEALDAGDTRSLTVTYDVSDGTASVANTASLVIEGRNEAPDAQDDVITTVRSATPVPRGEAFVVAGSVNEEDEPAVAVLADGSFVVAYEREEFEPADPNDPDSSLRSSAAPRSSRSATPPMARRSAKRSRSTRSRRARRTRSMSWASPTGGSW